MLQRKVKKEWYCQLQLAAVPPSATREKNTSLNEDALVPPSDVDRDQSRYSQSESTYRYSDGSTKSEASEEEGQATKKLTTDMLEQPTDNEQLVRKFENVIAQNPGATTKKPAIGQRPANEETVCRPVVEIVRKHGVQ
jgi:hypothetical protein